MTKGDATKVVRAIVIDGCRLGSAPMSLRIVYPLSSDVDTRGVCRDAIWRVRTHGTPDRYMRMYKGSASIDNLLSIYTFRDASGCTFSQDSKSTEANALENAQQAGIMLSSSTRQSLRSLRKQRIRRIFAAHLPERCGSIPCLGTICSIGVPQRTADSGVCWWGSVLWIIRIPPLMRMLVDAAISTCTDVSTASELQARLPKVLEHPMEATLLHNRLFELHNIGDAPGISAAEEGQNGYTQMCMIARVLGIKGITLDAPGLEDITDRPLVSKNVSMPPLDRPGDTEPGFLGVRVGRRPWTPQLRMRHAGRDWELCGGFLGSELCGHQTAVARACRGTWSHYDSDSCRLGIGAYAFRMNDRDWSHTLENTMCFSNSTSQTKTCIFTPTNRHVLHVTNELLRAHGRDGDIAVDESTNGVARSLNVDWVYVCVSM